MAEFTAKDVKCTWDLIAGTAPEKILAEVYQRYQDRLVQSHALDFDDLILRTVQLLQNLPEVAKALAEGVCRDYTLRQLPGLNHLFQTSKSGSPAEYGAIQETMAPVALWTISEWILDHTVGQRG